VQFEGQKIICSDNHRFFTANGEWVEARSLNGQSIRVLDKSAQCLNEVNAQVIPLPEAETKTVYNIEVEYNHNYFVGDEGALVHNKKVPEVD
ncbi:MAG TPA: Hint domain-containing protein, partial [Chthoniobacteraceae bacterium]